MVDWIGTNKGVTVKAGKRGRLALSFLLAAQMAISSVPLPALAEAVDEVQDLAEGQVVDVQEEGASEGEVNQAPVEAQAVTDAQTIVPDDDGRSNEELFAGYVQERIDQTLERGDGELSTQSATESTDGLSDVELTLYEILKTKIQEVTAGGDGGNASTEFVVSFDDLYGEDAFVFTAADLGVENIVEDGVISAQALAEAEARIEEQGPSTSAVVNALIADCPYDLYWFDKSKTGGMETTSGWQWSASRNGEEYVLSAVEGTYTFRFAVAQEYSAGEYLVDTSHAGSIDTALANAQSIVDDNAEGSVYNRLLAYKDAICNRVAYNDDAADETTNTPYGNPWQLIWVFDNDESTNVVCEGYSKAFKYLVDLTEDINATCYIATGTMAGGTGAGPHMWNIVTMDDGRNYLVDVTNCDEETVGAPSELFVAKPSSGSVEDGYVFQINEHDISYVYSEGTKSTYNEGVLELSDAAYDGPSEDPIDEPSAEELTLDVAQHVSSDNYWVGRFTAPENGTYVFYSEGDADTFGELYADEELEESINSNDDAADRNFQIIQTLTAGQTVYVKVRQYSDEPFECDVFARVYDPYDLAIWTCEVDSPALFAGSEPTIQPRICRYDNETGDWVYLDPEHYRFAGYEVEEEYEDEDGYTDTRWVAYEGTDWAAGSYRAVYEGTNGYSGKVRATFELFDERDLESGQWSAHLDWDSFPMGVEPELHVTIYRWDDEADDNVYLDPENYRFAGYEVEEEYEDEYGDYDTRWVAYEGTDWAAGRYRAVYEGTNGYSGKVRATFELFDEKNLDNWVCTAEPNILFAGSEPTFQTTIRRWDDEADDYVYLDPEHYRFAGYEVEEEYEDEDGYTDTRWVAYEGTDWAAGRYRAVYEGTNGYSGRTYGEFELRSASRLDNGMWELSLGETSFPKGTEPALAPTLSVKDEDGLDDRVLELGKDYELARIERYILSRVDDEDEGLWREEYQEVTDGKWDAGTYRVTYSGLGGYEGEISTWFTLYDEYDIGDYCWSADFAGGEYLIPYNAGNPVALPEVQITNDKNGSTLSNEHYRYVGYAEDSESSDGQFVEGATPSEIGEYYAVYEGIEPYTGRIYCYFRVYDATSIFELYFSKGEVAIRDFAYRENFFDACTGYVCVSADPQYQPEVRVAANGTELVEGTDYTLEYGKSFGYTTVSVIGRGSYTGEATLYYKTVDKVDLNKYLRVRGCRVATDYGTSDVDDTYDARLLYPVSGAAVLPTVSFPASFDSDAGGYVAQEGKDFTVSYVDSEGKVATPTEAGEYAIVLTAKEGSDFTGTVRIPFKLTEKLQPYDPVDAEDISGATISVAAQTYAGHSLEPAPVVTLDGNTLNAGTDYSVDYANNTNAGTATLTVTGKGNYTGSVETTFAISPATITSVEVVAGAEGFTFTGEEIRPELKVMAGDLTLAASDYDVIFANNVSMGEASVAVTGKGNFTGNATATFQIAGASFAGATVSAADQVYTGQALEPPVTVTLGGKTLVEGKDYSVSFQNNTNAGEAQIVATGMGDYSGSATGTFQIEQANLSDAQVVPARQTYTGEALEPAVTVTLDGRALAEGDFTATYSNNTNAGTGSVAIQGKGNYKGSASGEFTIDPRAITSVDGAATVQYTGHQISPQFTVVADGVTLSASDYGVTYEGDLVELGEVVATITAKGNFTGELTYRFSIVDEPADPNDPNSVAGKLSGELAAAQQAADDAAADVADKQQKYDAAKAAYDEAKAAAESDEQYASLQAAKEAAQLELDEAIANRDAKQQALEAAQAAVTENNAAITQAQTTLETKQTAATQAASDYEAALTAEQAAKGVRDAAQTAVNTKQAAVDAAEAAAAAEVAKGSVGFFDTKGSTTASGYLTDTSSMAYYSGGSVSFASLTNVGAANDATALANMLEAIDWIEYCNNTYRVPNGLTPLKISDNMMASAQRNANFSTFKYTHALDENGYMNMAEDGDGGSAENLYVTRIGKEAAYRGWYDAEKETWDAAVAADPSLVQYVGNGYQLMLDNPTLYHQVGHYFNIADPSYNVTGIGLNSTSSGAAIQQFAVAGSASSMGGTYTVDEYRQRFLAYYNAIAGDDVAANEKAALADAQAALDDAQADYEAAQANTAQKKQAKDDADAEVTTAQAALDALEGQSQSLAAAVTNAQNDLQAAETVVTNKQDAYDTAEAALTSYAAETTANLNTLKGVMDAAETTLNAAKATQAAADEALAAVQATFTQAHTITDDNVQITGISDFTYTGTAQKQSGLSVLFRMTVGDKTETYQLVEDTDYAIGYSGDATNVGTITMTIAGKGDYSGAVVRTYGITPATITSVDAADTTFTGSALGTTLVVKAGDLTLEPSDYDVVYDKNTNAGTATVTVTGKGNFQGSKTTEFLIAQADVSAAQVSAPNQAYTGNALEPEVTVKLGKKTLVAGDDYDVVYKGNTNAGTATITVTGKGNYVGTATGSFTIASASITSVDAADTTFTGSALGTTLVVKAGDLTLEPSDYDVAYDNNTNAGTATVTVTGKGNYAGSATGTFQIARKDIAGATVTVLTATYTGEELKPNATVDLDGRTLAASTDYEVAYANNTNAGTANVTVTGKGNYTGTVTSSFTINAASIANAEVTVASQPYTGKALEPKVTVKLGSKVIPTSEYEVSWSEELVNMGTHTITVRGLGKNLTGTKNADFVITKALSSISIEDQTKTYTGKAVVYDAKPTTSGSLGEVTYAYFHDEQCLMPVDAAYVKNAGTYYVRATLAGDSNHEGVESNVAKLTIAPATIAGAAISGVANKTYNGKAQTQNPVVKLGATTLKAGTDYTVSYKNNINAGRATLTVTGKGNYTGAKTAAFAIAKAANPMVATAKKVTLKASNLKKKAQKVKATKAMTVANNQGAITYGLAGVSKKKFKKYFKVAQNGKITVKKGLKKGTYKVKINVTAAGNANYNALTKLVTVTVKVK